MIKMQIIGNLGKDCNVREVNGKKVINFSVAHTDKYKDAMGNPKERTTWVECSYWTDRVAVADYLTKGRTVYAEGSPEADAFTNKEGQPAATLRMRVSNIQLLGSNTEQGSHNGASSNNVSQMGHATAPVMKTTEASAMSATETGSRPTVAEPVSYMATGTVGTEVGGSDDLPF